MVLEKGGRRVMMCCSRQWGKSTVTAIAAVHRALFVECSEILVLSRSGRQSGEVVRKAKRFVRQLGMKVRGDGTNRMSVVFPNGSRIVGLPMSEETIRGFSAVTLMVVDEAAFVSDELYGAVKPMLATTDGSLWLMSTPQGKRGFFYREWAHSEEGDWLRVHVPATECARIPARFLEEERRKVSDREFREEYMCEFLQGDDALFREEDVMACVRDDLEPSFSFSRE